MKRVIVQILKQAGFESIESGALEILLRVFSDRLISYLNTVSQKAIHSSRSSVTLTDLFSMNNQIYRIGKTVEFTNEILVECNVTIPNYKYESVRNLFSIIHINRENYPEELLEPEVEWISPLATRVEKYIHIYDFMPNFPPTHTFRMTPIKQLNNKFQSTKVKNRLEQSLSSEGNMVKLIKSSGTMPKFINFLYKGKI